jgi:hypothetical protein
MLAGLKMVLTAGFAPALATLSTSCLFYWTTRAVGTGLRLDSPAGVAPAESLYKSDPSRCVAMHRDMEAMVAVSGAAPETAGL